MFAAMNKEIARTKLRPAIDRIFPFEEAKTAYAYQASGAHFGKVVIGID
jgi:NADPH:quinone reductase-like Zn-dependent oxidoreductase